MERICYLDFELKLERKEDQYIARLLQSPAGEASSVFKLPFSDDRLELLVQKLGGHLRSNVRSFHKVEMEAAQELGGKIFDAVFSGDVLGCFRSSLDIVSRNEETGLRIKLRLQEVPELADLPWEFLFDSSLNRFIAQSNQTPIIRYIEMHEWIKPLKVNLPLQILVITSSPRDYCDISVECERSSLEKALKPLSEDGKVNVKWLENATLSDIHHCLQEGEYHVFHFIGHGGFDEKTQEGVLLLEDGQRNGCFIGAHRISTLLHDHRSLRLVVLNSCEGARNSRIDPFAGMAASLIRQGIPAVVAMQFEITDSAAIKFAGEFYYVISRGYPVDAAVAEARKEIYASDNEIEWGTPVLYMRAPNGELFDIEVSEEQAELSALYSEGIKALGAQDWQAAINHFKKILILDAGYKDASAKLKEAERQAELSALYSKGVEALGAQDWQAAINHFKKILTLDPGYKDARAKLKEAERQAELLALYSEGIKALGAQDWQTAINHFKKILTLDPGYKDARAKLKEAIEPPKKEKIKKLAIVIIAMIAIVLLALPQTTINVSPANISIDEGKIQEFNTHYELFNIPIPGTVTWSSSNTTVGTIDSTGKFIALAPGNTTITASSESISGNATVTVTAQVLTSINVSPAMATVVVNKTELFVYYPRDQINRSIAVTVTWSSSDTNVGTIDNNGLFTAKAIGTTTITAKNKTVSGTATVTVTDEFVLISAGEFYMGSNDSWSSSYEIPVHRVKITKAFYLGKYEVTQKQWRDVMGTNPSYFTGDDRPVESVSWDDVQQFIKTLNEKEGTTRYRLPSEAEWEYAVRAGTTTRYYFGDDESKLDDYEWYRDNSDSMTHPVGYKNPNSWGLYDMLGNVQEWVQDKWHLNYEGAPYDGSAWETGTFTERVDRGGSWNRGARLCRSSDRNINDPGMSTYILGFRLVRDLKPLSATI